MKQKTIFVSLILFFMFFVGLEIVTTATEERSIVDASEKVGFALDKMFVENWVAMDINGDKNPENLLKEIAAEVGLLQPYKIRKSSHGNDYTYVLTKPAKDVESTISIRHMDESVIKDTKRYYVRVKYTLKDKFHAGEELKIQTKQVLQKYGPDPISNISCQGYYPGNLFIDERSGRKLKELESFFGIKFHKREEQMNLINAYGYSWRFNDFIILKGDKVSVELRMDFDQARDTTKLMMGLPVIKMDY